MNNNALTQIAETTEALTEMLHDFEVAGIEAKTLITLLATGAAIFAAGTKFGIELIKTQNTQEPFKN